MALISDKKKCRIGVFMGGKSIEREVSFNSGRTVCDHLDTAKYSVVPIFQTEQGELYLLPWHFLHRGKIADFRARLEIEAERITWENLKNLVDYMYIATHGRYGEDGTLQGMLEVLGIPYLGAKVFGSALGMNKAVQKKILRAANIDVPRGFVVEAHELSSCTQQSLVMLFNKAELVFPCVVKPSHEGSSLGLTIVRSYEDLLQAVHTAGYADERFAQDVIVEEKVQGMEFVCVSLEKINPKDDEHKWYSLPITQVIPEKNTDFFDYEQKYMPGRATKQTPADCSEEDTKKIIDVCQKVSDIMQFSTLSRIDGILTDDGRVVIIDPNTLTGMGPTTFLFHQAAHFGMSHGQLINLLIKKDLLAYGLIANQADEQEKGLGVATTQKKRIGVLLGGDSNEREISLESGRNVCYKLSSERYHVMPLFVNEAMELYALSSVLLIKNSTREIADAVTSEMRVQWSELPNLIDFAFIGLHGGRGENGSVQGALEMLGIPYNGSGVLASAMCMDKYKTNLFLASQGFYVPQSVIIEYAAWKNFDQQDRLAHAVAQSNQMSLPLIVKPHDDGCSVMVARVETMEELVAALDLGFSRGKQKMMVEEFVKGMELTCGVYGNDNPIALPPSRAVVQKAVLSMAEKFLPGAGENQTPAPISPTALALVQDTVAQAFKSVGCKGYARIDCFYQSAEDSSTGHERVVFLEFNTLPALTPATCLFHQAAEVSMRPMQFIEKIIELGIELHKPYQRQLVNVSIKTVKVDTELETQPTIA